MAEREWNVKPVPIRKETLGIVSIQNIPHVGPLLPRLRRDCEYNTYAVGFNARICAEDWNDETEND